MKLTETWKHTLRIDHAEHEICSMQKITEMKPVHFGLDSASFPKDMGRETPVN